MTTSIVRQCYECRHIEILSKLRKPGFRKKRILGFMRIWTHLARSALPQHVCATLIVSAFGSVPKNSSTQVCAYIVLVSHLAYLFVSRKGVFSGSLCWCCVGTVGY